MQTSQHSWGNNLIFATDYCDWGKRYGMKKKTVIMADPVMVRHGVR
ncbi:MAG: hypothetical protein II842_10935 [Butyrivibrio sp.]|nr:hypothetical protein [Butyrivibrio sp.]